MQILVVEDEPLLRSFLSEVLGASYDVAVAASAQAAMALLQCERCDVVLADLELGGGQPSGRRLLDEVAVRWPSTRRILMSETPLDTGDLVLAKPLRMEELLRAVRSTAPDDGERDAPPPTQRRPRHSFGAGLRSFASPTSLEG